MMGDGSGEKFLMVFPELCTGCRDCEIVCTIKHEKVINPERARIRVIRDVFEGLELPVVCMQCIDAPCVEACRVDAIYEDERGAKIIDYEKCIGCRRCIIACPLGAAFLDPVTKKPVKCDLCNGDPVCVKFCSTGAVRHVDAETLNREKMKLSSEKYMEVIKQEER
jgi:Fe-S-cluster-containing hydrogenase component 2